jgi:limonene 1,2-monooxygenase
MIFLSHLTNGRAAFGWGVGGGIPSDLTVFGLDTAIAGRRMSESLETMLLLLDASEPVTIESDWFSLQDAVLQLRPYSDPHMKFAVASTDRRNVELMGRLGGDVLIGGMPGHVGELMQHLSSGAREFGREASRDQIKLSYVMHITEDRAEAIEGFRQGAIDEFYEFQVGVNGRPTPASGPDKWYEDYVDRNIIGSVDDAVEKLSAIVESSGGVGGFIFMSRNWAGSDANEESWRLFAERVIPKLG